MDRVWAPEIAVDASLASALIEEQFRELAPVSVEPIGSGWDNTVFRVNKRFVFRFPRRQIAVDLIATELRCLPILAPRLPVPIPVPMFTGQPASAYPWPFAGYGYLPGTAASRTTTDATRIGLALAIAAFLKALHSIPRHDVSVAGLPPDRLARLDTGPRRSRTESRLAFLVAAGLIHDPKPILEVVASSPPPASARLVVAHGDLHIGQLLTDQHGRLSAVLDWGDAHVGHPAVDLAVAHQLLPADRHESFRSVYGPVDAETWALARQRAAWHAVAVLASAADSGDTALAREMQLALQLVSARRS